MIESCPECQGKLSSQAATCPHCGWMRDAAPTEAATAPQRTQVKAGPAFLDPKKNARALLRLFVIFAVGACLIGGWFVFRFIARAGSGTGSLGGIMGPRVLVSESQQVTDSSVMGYTFSLWRASKLNLDLDFIAGESVTAYVMDVSEYKKCVDAHGKLFGGQFRHYEAFEGVKKKQHRAYGTLGAGTYVLCVKEGSDANILGGSDTAHVKVRLTAE
jgi:hypothetical protein